MSGFGCQEEGRIRISSLEDGGEAEVRQAARPFNRNSVRKCVHLIGVGIGVGIGIDVDSDSDADPD